MDNSAHVQRTHDHHDPSAEAASATALKDPVCGMTVSVASPHHLEHAGKPNYFCSPGCKAKFAAEPAKYLHAPAEVAAPGTPPSATPGTVYTCPMHSQIRQDHPGVCPICGMSLADAQPGR